MQVARGNNMDFDQVLGWFIHTVSSSAIIAAVVGFLPAIFALAPFLYYVLLLSRDPTVKAWRNRRRMHKINKLRMELKELEAKQDRPRGDPDA